MTEQDWLTEEQERRKHGDWLWDAKQVDLPIHGSDQTIEVIVYGRLRPLTAPKRVGLLIEEGEEEWVRLLGTEIGRLGGTLICRHDSLDGAAMMAVGNASECGERIVSVLPHGARAFRPLEEEYQGLIGRWRDWQDYISYVAVSSPGRKESRRARARAATVLGGLSDHLVVLGSGDRAAVAGAVAAHDARAGRLLVMGNAALAEKNGLDDYAHLSDLLGDLQDVLA